MLLALLALLPLAAAEEVTEELETSRHHKDHHFDLLILTQHWPYTTCLEWEDRKGGCRKIEQARWTVHGLWPTQIGKIAPNYCNDSWHFDHTVLRPIKGNLTIFWPDVEIREGHIDSLWSHEWTKHGTCAAQLPELDSELKYFSKGCELAEANPVTTWLHGAGILPNKNGTTYSMKRVWDAVMAGTGGKRPHIDCEKIEGEVFIKEIKVCFDKNFARIDCDGILNNGSDNMMGTCLRYSDFLYPSTTVLPHLKLRSGVGNTTDNHTTTTLRPTTTTAPPLSNSGLVAGIICSVLALAAVGLAVGYIIYRRGRRSHRGYESL